MNKKLLFVVIFSLLSVGQVFANQYKASLNTIVSGKSTGMGKVYAGDSITPGTYEPDSSRCTTTSKNEGDMLTFYAFAQTNDDNVYGFSGWSETEGGMIVSTDNPYKVELKSAQGETDKNLYTLYANFFEKNICDITFVAPTNGTYTATDGTTTITNSGTISTRESISLSATPADGYKLMDWYAEDESGKRTYFSYDTLCQQNFVGNVKVGVEFITEDTPFFLIKGKDTPYTDLTSANSDATSGDIIILKSGGILEKGDYNIKNGVTLLIPYNASNSCFTEIDKPLSSQEWTEPYPYRTLTFVEGTNLSVDGSISVSAEWYSVNSSSLHAGGGVNGAYGHIKMGKGSSMTLNNGSNLYAFGYITGEGQINAEEGSNVYEAFQMTEFRGGSAMQNMTNKDSIVYEVFPINQYFVQNVEAPMTICYGAAEKLLTTVHADNKFVMVDPFVFIGKDGMFILADGAKLTKSYDPLYDRQKYVLEGDAKIGDILFTMDGNIVNSELYVLPLTNNLSIEIKNGILTIDRTKGVSLLPDAHLTIDEDAKLLISNSKLYVYDSNEWGEYVGLHHKANPREFAPTYSPTKVYERTTLSDATLDVKGIVETNKGILYTTEGGANVCCSDGEGKVVVYNDSYEVFTYQATQSGTTARYCPIAITPVKLKNANAYEGTDEEYTITENAADGTTYYFHQETGKWDTNEIPTNIDDVNYADGKADIYDLNGVRRVAVKRGINILKLSNGEVLKYFVK